MNIIIRLVKQDAKGHILKDGSWKQQTEEHLIF
jgi:hypothetical protein